MRREKWVIFSSRTISYILIAVLLSMNVGPAGAASFRIVYDTPKGQKEKDARAFIVDEGITQTVSTLLEDDFALRGDLSLFLGGTQGPSFDASSGEIRMPYGFVFTAADRFKRDSYSRTGVDIYDVARDVYLHALLHEVSHSLFLMYDLRTSGDMEKAVDALTILLLIRYYDDGGDIAMNAAELFVDEGGSSVGRGSGGGFWIEHEFDQQSYNQAICLVYGSDPRRYSALRDRSEFLQIRDRECIREYQRQVDAWFRVLGSFLKRPPPG